MTPGINANYRHKASALLQYETADSGRCNTRPVLRRCWRSTDNRHYTFSILTRRGRLARDRQDRQQRRRIGGGEAALSVLGCGNRGGSCQQNRDRATADSSDSGIADRVSKWTGVEQTWRRERERILTFGLGNGRKINAL